MIQVHLYPMVCLVPGTAYTLDVPGCLPGYAPTKPGVVQYPGTPDNYTFSVGERSNQNLIWYRLYT